MPKFFLTAVQISRSIEQPPPLFPHQTCSISKAYTGLNKLPHSHPGTSNGEGLEDGFEVTMEPSSPNIRHKRENGIRPQFQNSSTGEAYIYVHVHCRSWSSNVPVGKNGSWDFSSPLREEKGRPACGVSGAVDIWTRRQQFTSCSSFAVRGGDGVWECIGRRLMMISDSFGHNKTMTAFDKTIRAVLERVFLPP